MTAPDRAALALILLVLAASLVPKLGAMGGGWPLRCAALAAWAWTAWRLRPDGKWPLWVTPGFLLATAALGLYILGPAIYFALTDAPPALPAGAPPTAVRHLLPDWGPQNRAATLVAVGSPAELLVLRLVLALLMASLALKALARPRTAALAVSGRLGLALGLLACAGHVVMVRAGFGPGVLALAQAAYVTALAVAVLDGDNRQAWRVTLLLVGAGAAGFLPLALKAWVFAAGMAFAGLALRRRRVAVVLVAAAAMTVLVLAILGPTRYAGFMSDKTFAHLAREKLVFRQGESMYCLRHAVVDADHRTGPFYFSAALVPRVLWPGKPVLSQGDIYATRYCGWTDDDFTNSRHSSSVTLLGEPAIHGGPAGLALAGGLVVLATLGGGLALRRGGAAAAVSFAALPLLVDFDQQFSIWLAAGLKNAVVAVFLLWIMGQLAARSRT